MRFNPRFNWFEGEAPRMRLIRTEENRSDHLPGYRSSGFVPEPIELEIGCISRSGVHRHVHTWDRDGRCIFCDVLVESQSVALGEGN